MASKYAVAYSSPAGPGDSRPTASMILEDESMHGKLAGKVIFITGASCGLGAGTALSSIPKLSPHFLVRPPTSHLTSEEIFRSGTILSTDNSEIFFQNKELATCP